MKNQGVLKGYGDGTFKPGNPVNRVEVLKILFLGSAIQVASTVSDVTFPDVPAEEWFATYVKKAKDLKIIKGNPDGTFAPARQVNKAEFLKMMLAANNVDLSGHQNLDYDLYPDAKREDWFLPYVSYAKNIGLIYPNGQGYIEPAKALTRGEVAEIMYRLIVVQKGGEVQQLLSQAEANLVQVLQDVQKGDVSHAEIMVGDAVNFTSQALTKRPDEKVVKAAVKIAEAFQQLVEAYKLGQEGKGNDAVEKANQCKNTATAAWEEDNAVQPIAHQIKVLAQSIIDQVLEQTTE